MVSPPTWLNTSAPPLSSPHIDQRGESYQDVFLRLEPVIFEMLRTTTPLLIVGHQAILRVIYGCAPAFYHYTIVSFRL